ncbi:Uncharacterised protein [Mycobacteroides abscessus subsp. abscessus]|nr:Uncharacterised protein [Mycobacteroides abscessus subsp. abscessus]SHR91403.1 Uncharacterised protein [Mycobacteroides abscessus subsp. abscessus]SIH64504.1 Uncharacterised protein [Mycobacteroides abscessus subsp. abscessus]
MQRPHRSPTPRTVPHRPRRQPLSFSALTTTQNLGSTPHQPQRQRSPLHNPLVHPSTRRQGLIRRPTMPPRLALGEQRPRISHLDHVLPRHPVTGHQVPNLLVPQVIGNRHLNTRPPLRTRPHRHTPVRITTRCQSQPRTPPRRIRHHRRHTRQRKLTYAAWFPAPHMRPGDDRPDCRARPGTPQRGSAELLHIRHTPTRTLLRTTTHTRFTTTAHTRHAVPDNINTI